MTAKTKAQQLAQELTVEMDPRLSNAHQAVNDAPGQLDHPDIPPRVIAAMRFWQCVAPPILKENGGVMPPLLSKTAACASAVLKTYFEGFEWAQTEAKLIQRKAGE